MHAPVPSTGQKSTPSESDADGGMKGSTTAIRTWAILTFGAIAMACLLALLPAAGHDQMWLLYAANLVRHGAQLYGPELFESNPPLAVWISLVPSALAAALHLPATTVGKSLMVCLGAGVAPVCLSLLRRVMPVSPAKFWALSFVYITAFAVVPARDFGQRDHLLAFLCLPYLLAAAGALDGKPVRGWQAVVVGFAAGVGIALKPHQMVVPVAVELALLACRRNWRSLLRPELLTLAATGALYLAAIRILCPAYLHTMLPLLRDTYWAFADLTWWQLVGEAVQLHLLALVALGVALVLGRIAPVSLVFLVAGAAATTGYYLQRTGWYYQQLPALTFFIFAVALLAIDLAKPRKRQIPNWSPLVVAALCVVALGMTAHFMNYPFTEERSFPIETPDSSFFMGLNPGTPVATLTTTVDYTVPPAFRYHLTLAQRYPHLWLLPAILRAESGEHPMPHARLAQLEQIQHEAMVEDFLRWQPALVLVERCQDPDVHCQVLEDRHIDLLAWFSRDSRFRNLFMEYRFWRSAGTFDAYVRK